MKQIEAIITRNEPLTAQVFRMVLESPDMEQMKPGQFVNIRPEGLFLRRPISVYDSEAGRLTVVYKTVGKGTERMSRMKTGETLDLLTGLGNGYDLNAAGEAPLLLGGGVGVPPMYLLAKRLREAGKQVCAVLGFNTAAEVFCEEEFIALGCRVTVTTDSRYVVDGIEKGWAKSWRAKGWVKADRKPALNPELWGRLLDLLEGHEVTFCWIKGHAGHPENERCDRLAVAEWEKFKA